MCKIFRELNGNVIEIYIGDVIVDKIYNNKTFFRNIKYKESYRTTGLYYLIE